MKSYLPLTLLALALTLLASPCTTIAADLEWAGQTWKSYSGEKDLPLDVTPSKCGTLTFSTKPKGYLYTTKKYKNFVMKFQWKRDKANPGPAGVLIRTTGENKIWPKCLEMQLNKDSAGDFVSLQGFAYNVPKEVDKKRITEIDHPDFGKVKICNKAKDVEKKLGEWNDYEIVAKDDVVTIRVNGELINTATDCETEPGVICLTSEGAPISFKNLSIEETK